MRKTIVLCISLCFSFHLFAQKTMNYGGIYTYNSTDKDSSQTGLLIICPESDSTMFFWIHTTIMMPDLQSWGNFGIIKVKDNTGIYYRRTTPEPGGLNMDCMLSFKFADRKVEVAPVKGHDKCLCYPGTHDYGMFNIKSKEIPKYFIYANRGTIYFNSAAVKLWEQF